MNIDLMRDFLCCAETLSLTRAAERRNTTQSNMSKRLRSLEEYLGQALIDRSDRPITLTQAGLDFLPVARQILSEIDVFKGRSAPWYPTEGGLSIAMPHSATVTVFSRFKEWLSHRLPETFFAPKIANHDMAAHMLAHSEVDLAIVTRHPNVSIDERFAVFSAVDIASDRLVIVEPPGTADLTELPLHVSHELTYIGKIWQTYRDTAPASAEVEHGMAADIRAHCLAGRGRGVLPETLVEMDIVAGRLLLCPTKVEMKYMISLYCAPRAQRRANRLWTLCSEESPLQ